MQEQIKIIVSHLTHATRSLEQDPREGRCGGGMGAVSRVSLRNQSRLGSPLRLPLGGPEGGLGVGARVGWQSGLGARGKGNVEGWGGGAAERQRGLAGGGWSGGAKAAAKTAEASAAAAAAATGGCLRGTGKRLAKGGD